MTTVTWSPEELERIGAADELQIAARRGDGSLRRAVPIWVVRVGGELYVRSWKGTDGAWFRAATAAREAHISAGGIERDVALTGAGSEVDDAIDEAYREKYSRYPSYVSPMISAKARATTLRLVPPKLGSRV